MTNYQATIEGRCIFCEIAQGRLQTPRIFWEDENFIAFLSIFPNTEGFTVLITKQHFSSDCLMLPPDILQKTMVACQKIAEILKKHFTDVGRVGVIMEGMGVNHAHIKLIPMHNTEELKTGTWKQYLSGKSDFFKTYPGYLVSADGPRANEIKLKELAEKLKNYNCEIN